MTTVFEIDGDSMGPALVRGSRVLVAPLSREVRAGDVVLLRATDTPVLHRVVLTFVEDGVLWLVHRGDCGGRPAVAPGTAVVGRAVGLLAADLEPVPSPDELGPRERRAFRRAQWLAHAYVCGRRAVGLGLSPRRPEPPVARPSGPPSGPTNGGQPFPAYNERTLNEQEGPTDSPSPPGGSRRKEGEAVGRGSTGLSIAPGLAWRLVEGEAAVVDLTRGRTVGLNRTASLVWSLLADHDEPAIVEAVAERFQIDAETARADVRRFLATLRAHGLAVEG